MYMCVCVCVCVCVWRGLVSELIDADMCQNIKKCTNVQKNIYHTTSSPYSSYAPHPPKKKRKKEKNNKHHLVIYSRLRRHGLYSILMTNAAKQTQSSLQRITHT